MADSDKTLKLLIELGVIGQADAEAANKLLAETKTTAGAAADESARYEATLQAMADKEEAAKDGVSDLNEAVRDYAELVKSVKAELGEGGDSLVPENLAGNIAGVGTAEEEAGEKASSSRTKHLLLHHAFAELDKIIPGLGTIVNAFERELGRLGEASPRAASGLVRVGQGAEAAGAGCAAAEPAVASLITTLGPLIIIMESVQLATQLWDLHTEAVQRAAAAQAEAYKQIDEASKKALAAQLELNEALHPTPDAVKGLEKELRDKERDIKNQVDRQKETNKAEENQELATATTPAQKDAIKKKWAIQNQNVDEMAEHARIEAENQAASKADAQIGANTQKSDADKAAAGAAMRQAAQAETVAQNNYDHAMPGGAKAGLGAQLEAAKAASEKARAEIKRLDEESAKLDTDSAHLAEFRNKTRDTAGEDQTNFSFRQGTRAQVNTINQKTDNEQAVRNYAPAAANGSAQHLQTLQQLEAETGKSEAQKAAILQRILAHQLTAQAAWASTYSQLEQLESQIAHNRGTQNSG